MAKSPGRPAQARAGLADQDSLPFAPTQIAVRLLSWYGRAGRTLPWRTTRDPYRIWLSEVMLQQTTVEAVIPYYQRFLEVFPDVRLLAATSVDEVIALWAGLGYYSRARNLHAAARMVVEAHGGVFPESLEGLMALPGVGRSTAGAILSIAFDRPAPILDGNVRRVLCRLFALQENPRGSAAEKKLWAWAQALTPEDHPHDYAQAIMDLGATLCVPRRPDCPHCPLTPLCRAYALGLAEQLPVAAAKKALPEVLRVALLVERRGVVLVRRRPYRGLLGGMWEFPDAEVRAGQSPEKVAAQLASGFNAIDVQPVGAVRHAYSHFRLEVRLYRALGQEPQTIAEDAQCRWVARDALAALALHGAHKKALCLVADAG